MAKTLQQEMAPIQKALEENARETLPKSGGEPNLEMSLPPHMSDRSLGGGYVTDNAARTRAENAQTDKNLSSVPTPKNVTRPLKGY